MNRKQLAALETIYNFILYLSSNETERDRLYEIASAYVEQDHALADNAAATDEREDV